ncbi:MAG: hypothetical protein DCC43_11820 [Candidatus Brocadia sp.]|uniref:ABC-type transport auxiliary lipoprotein component domain-containing protein n=1 Tax=Candidatus Brocadia fulgida TaxID=380242 RepID=A0A0M2UQX9_9BACT|nr:MAG: hypothetical protein BROFUL_03254 [Candidatus Brocadia fulgida]MCC6326166.1 hypothetical protein [Candidatus Brocadia sp.]MCE7912597.1 hypothetical protein [Candidatus Brocadia sp. AMX3]MBV6517913.1 hypothetical protein [Candidatus Brocadia fulgida]MDG5998012.1 hypothetical protein [Candidatus Brocadia sp.]
MHPVKYFSCKYAFILLIFLASSGCLSGQRPPVTISPQLDKRVRAVTPLPMSVGLYIAPHLRNYVQEAPIKQYEAGAQLYTFPDFVFPFGEPLAAKIEEMSNMLFTRVTVLDHLQNTANTPNGALDGILTVDLKSSDIELYIEQSVWRAIGRHNLSITASFFDLKQNKIWESDIAVEGKGLDFITSRVEQEWWATTGPRFGPAVEDSIQQITYELAKKITTAKEMTDYIATLKQ